MATPVVVLPPSVDVQPQANVQSKRTAASSLHYTPPFTPLVDLTTTTMPAGGPQVAAAHAVTTTSSSHQQHKEPQQQQQQQQQKPAVPIVHRSKSDGDVPWPNPRLALQGGFLPRDHPLLGTFCHAPSTGASSSYFADAIVSHAHYKRQRAFRNNPYTGALASNAQLHRRLHERVQLFRNSLDVQPKPAGSGAATTITTTTTAATAASTTTATLTTAAAAAAASNSQGQRRPSASRQRRARFGRKLMPSVSAMDLTAGQAGAQASSATASSSESGGIPPRPPSPTSSGGAGGGAGVVAPYVRTSRESPSASSSEDEFGDVGWSPVHAQQRLVHRGSSPHASRRSRVRVSSLDSVEEGDGAGLMRSGSGGFGMPRLLRKQASSLHLPGQRSPGVPPTPPSLGRSRSRSSSASNAAASSPFLDAIDPLRRAPSSDDLRSSVVAAVSGASRSQSKRLRLAIVPPSRHHSTGTDSDGTASPRPQFESIGVAPAHLDINDSYELMRDEVLGEGAFATVIRARPRKRPRRAQQAAAAAGGDSAEEEAQGSGADTRERSLVVKVINKRYLFSDEEKKSIVREALIHSRLHHPNIVELRDTFESPEHVYMVMEAINGQDLHRYMKTKGTFSETEAAALMKQLMQAIEYIHGNNLVHCDVKPQNVLLVNDAPGEGATLGVFRTVKLCDFGNARRAIDAKYYKQTGSVSLVPFSVVTGTMGFVAPELLRRKPYDSSVDIWSAGVLLYELLVGFSPFYPYSSCVDMDVEFPARYWDKLSTHARALTRGMLQRDPKKRLTAKQVLAHPWFNSV